MSLLSGVAKPTKKSIWISELLQPVHAHSEYNTHLLTPGWNSSPFSWARHGGDDTKTTIRLYNSVRFKSNGGSSNFNAVPSNCIISHTTSHFMNLSISKQHGVFSLMFGSMSGNRGWSHMCDSSAQGLWKIGISLRGIWWRNFIIPSSLLFTSAHTHDIRHCLDYIFIF